MDKVIKTFVAEVKSVDKKNLIVTHFISTEEPDRALDVVRAEGMVVRGRPAVLVGHDYNDEPVAKPLELTTGENKAGKKGIIAKTQYYPDDRGKRLFQKAIDGYMPNWSIGFSSIEDEPINNGGTDFKKWELLEYSQVAVPMNPGATIEPDGKNTNGNITFKYFTEEDKKEAEAEIEMEAGEILTTEKSIADRIKEEMAFDGMYTIFYGMINELWVQRRQSVELSKK